MKALRAVVLASLLTASAAWSQVVSGTIAGSVVDRSGAAIPRASVTLTNLQTGAVRQAPSDEAGRFLFASLPPGEYKLAASNAGFKSAEISNIGLLIDQTLRYDVVLDVGEVSERVTVEASTAALQTDNATLGQVIEQKSVTELPLNGRNFLQLATLSAGAIAATGGTAQSARYGRNEITVHIAGARASFNSFLIDGVEARGARFGEISILPSVDAIREFKIQRSQFSAEYGSSPGIINVSIRSGSNEFHGAAYHFLRNNIFDARNFFDEDRKPDFRLNQFGASIGGPVIRNKAFFFFNWESRRQRRSNTDFATVPPREWLNGDFSGLSTIIRDPFNNNQPFAGNRIPQDRINPIARRMNAFIPAPNLPGTVLNLVGTPKTSDDFDQFHVRGDYTISQSDSFFVRYSKSNWDLIEPGLQPFQGAFLPLNAHNAVFQETHIFGPATVNTFKLGFNRAYAGANVIPAPTNLAAEMGFANLQVEEQDFNLPRFTIAGLSNMGHTEQTFRNYTNLYTLSDTMSVVRGRHTMTFGGDIRHNRNPQVTTNQTNGRLTFQARYTGHAFADYLLGAYTQGLVRSLYRAGDFRQTAYAAFFQDDFKVTSKLTFNLGLRYEYTQPLRELGGGEGVFDPTIPGGGARVANPPSTFGTNISAPWLRVGDVRPGVVTPDFADWAPRIGFAYQVLPGTVLRGGYGIFYAQNQGNYTITVSNNPGAVIEQTLTNVAAGQRPRLMNTLWDSPQTVTSLGGAPSLNTVDVDRNSPYLQQWNFNIQQKLPFETVLEIGYTGNKGTKLQSREDMNQARLNNPGENLSVQARRPFSTFSSIFINPSAEWSNYHALMVRAERRFSKGFQVLANYTWAKSLDSFSASNDEGGSHSIVRNRALDYARSGADARHRFVASGTWELPFGKGKTFFANPGTFANYLVGGWQMNGILQLQSGLPFSVTIVGDQSFTGILNAQRPNRLADGNLPADQRTPDRWFDINAFVLNPTNTFGNAGRNILEQDGSQTVDLSLFKNIPLAERFVLQFRAEFFNAFNNVNFGRPGQAINGPQFGVVSSAGRGREIQFALRLNF
ncbi:MAG: TonB-dependent receptor [Bryobacteraceae bacterium]|nr:TonB-dependent receptor [Bryobacteraceae bacterium]